MHALLITAALSAAAPPPASVDGAPPPTRAEVEAEMGLPSDGDRVRGQLDTVGFVVTAAQAADARRTALAAEGESLEAQDARLGTSGSVGFVGGVCPHDDHLYAARTYVHLTERITAPRVILIGVFHKARLWDLHDVLVFDAFSAWHGPWGPVAVDPMRSALIEGLDPGSVVVSNAMHCGEHSLEAIVPWLQATDPEVRIVPVLVPYMRWGELDRLSSELADVLAALMAGQGWRLGRDVAVVVSSDAVHYGDDFGHAPFGTDAPAYLSAVEREHELVTRYLEGPLSGARVHGLMDELVDRDDVRSYRVPWCGRFSVPFGLELLRKVSELLGGGTPTGHLLRYSTSLADPQLAVSAATRETGLGTTAPSNLHHWVGYAAIGFLPGAAAASAPAPAIGTQPAAE